MRCMARGGLALFFLGGAMAQEGPVGRGQTVVGVATLKNRSPVPL